MGRGNYNAAVGCSLLAVSFEPGTTQAFKICDSFTLCHSDRSGGTCCSARPKSRLLDSLGLSVSRTIQLRSNGNATTFFLNVKPSRPTANSQLLLQSCGCSPLNSEQQGFSAGVNSINSIRVISGS